MSYSEFADKMLVALYQESECDNFDPWPITFGKFTSKYGLSAKVHWLHRLAEEWGAENLAAATENLGPPEGWEINILGRGLREIERRYGDKDGVNVILPPISGRSIGFEAAENERTHLWQNSSAPNDRGRIDSARWTGLPSSFVLHEQKQIAIATALEEAEQGLGTSSASQHDQAQARAYMVAAKALIEAPDPDPKLAWELIQRANSLAGIASLCVSIIALFVG